MPLEVGIWKLGDQPKKIGFSTIESEKKLEDALEKDISILSAGLMLIGRQVPTAYGKFLDLMAIDSEGNLTIAELKRHRTPRDVIAQLLDYASWAQTLTYAQISDLYFDLHKTEFEKGFAEAFGQNPPEKLNQEMQLILVAAELDNSSERIINYLADNFGVPVNAVFFRYFSEGGADYLTRSWLIDPQEAEAKSSRSARSGGKETWNGQDFYVSFGEGERRNWDDARKYGFVSGGGGRWYSRSLGQLFPGARVFVCIPGEGYVGVGRVSDPSIPVADFVVDVDGQLRPILEAPLVAPEMDGAANDPERCEYLVRIEWLKTLDRDQAYWETGMYANQNTATKLRNRFTLERLIKHFGVDEED